ncbi:MAG: peptide deformylase [Nocardioidaceae bacterium]
MAVREVLRYPHPSLKRVARELGLDELGEAARVAGDLVDTMRSHPGCVGLAAPQLDELVRVVAVDVSGHPKATSASGLLLLVNPRLVRREGAEVAREGCLSIPHLTGNVRRPTLIELAALAPDGSELSVEARGFEARCLVHELDHLDGVLFLDRVDSLATDVFRRRRYR